MCGTCYALNSDTSHSCGDPDQLGQNQINIITLFYKKENDLKYVHMVLDEF